MRMREPPPLPYSTLPPELWLEILQFLGPSSVSALCLASKYFARLSQPFIFQNISFRLRYSSKSCSQYMDYLSTRLIFMSNPNIAHRVRRESIFSEATKAENSIMDATLELIFHTLSSFPNLSELTCISIEITSRRLRSLLLVPTAALELQFCTYNPDLDTNRVPTNTLICSDDHRLAVGSSSEAPSVSPFLHVQHLRKLVVGHTAVEYILSAIAKSVETFSRLYSLDIPVDSLTMDDFTPAMSSCPEVRHLSLHFFAKSS